MTAPDGTRLPLADAEIPVDVTVLDLDGPPPTAGPTPAGPEPGQTREAPAPLARATLVLARRGGRPVSLFLARAGTAEESLPALAASAAEDVPLPPWPTPAPLPAATVVITTIRPGDGLRRTVLDALAQSTAPAEVVVVDNRPASSGVREWLAREVGDAVRYVPEPLPGLARARNAGLRTAQGEIVAFTDDDVRLDPDWLAHLCGGFAPGVDGVTGLVMPRRLHTDAQLLMERFGGFAKGLRPRLYDLHEHRVPDVLFPFSVGIYGSGANAAFRTDVLRRMGGLDPLLGTGRITRGGEDLDIFLRMILAGRTLAYEPAAVVWHDHEAELNAFSQRVLGYGVGLGAVLGKHFLLSGPQVRRQMVRRLPAAIHHLRSGESPKNAQKGDRYPLRYTWRERAGIIAGPAAYVLATRQGPEPRRGGRPSEPAVPPWPIWCTQVDLGEALPRVLAAPAGGGYRSARVLLRLHHEALGYATVRIDDGAVTREALLAAAGPELRQRARDHLRAEFGDDPCRDVPADAAVPPSSACPAAFMSPAPSVTVAVCTRDRGATLARCLAGLQRLRYPRLEILVVDNAPTDDAARAAYLTAVGDDPRFRYVVEPRPGLSRARNRAIREATGEVLAFTDDDVDVDPWWIDGLVRGFARAPHVTCVTGLICTAEVGGPVEAYFDRRVSWGDSCLPQVFSLARNGTDPLFPYSPGVFGAGANFACRTDVLRRLGGFDEALGAGTLTGGGEDLDLFVRVVLAGDELVYEPSAVVWHHHRADLDGLRRQMFAYGSGLSAFVAKHLLQRSTRGPALRRIPIGLRRLAHVPATTGQSFRELPLDPRTLLAQELCGMAAGPMLYLRAARRANREGRQPIDEPLGSLSRR